MCVTNVTFTACVVALVALAACDSSHADATQALLEAQAGELLLLPDGPVRGRSTSSTRSFTGIPYAAAPLGALRWRPPRPVARWTLPLDATERGAPCVQPEAHGSEDCLSVSVFAPAELPAAPAPVMVWLHGRGNTTDAASSFDGVRFREQLERDVVVVTVNYRLGSLGFFSHPALTAESGASGNYGLLDQQAALRWVQRNIRAFGGDPDRVTLLGSGTGAVDACYHLVARGSSGLYHAAVLQSGTCGTVALSVPAEAEHRGANDAAAHGCRHREPSRELDCLRKLPAVEFERAEPSGVLSPASLEATLQARAVVDGTFLHRQPSEAFRAGDFEKVPLIVGTARHDAAPLVPPLNDAAQYRAMLETVLGPKQVQAVLAQYSTTDGVSPDSAAVAALSDALYACPARRLAIRASHFTPSFVFSYDLATEATGMHDYWVRLVDGDVNASGALKWPEYASHGSPELVAAAELSISEDAYASRCALWETTSFAPSYRQGGSTGRPL